MEETKSRNVNFTGLILFTILNPAAVFLAGTVYGLELRVRIGAVILVGILTLSADFALIFGVLRDRLFFDNAEKTWRYYIAYAILFLGTLFYPLLPESGWPFLAVFVILMIFSSPFVALVSGAELLTVTMLLSGSSDFRVFLMYILPGIVGILLFSAMGEEFRVFVPMLVSTLFQLLTLSVYEALLSDRVFSAGLFLYPVLNAVISVAVLLIVLKFFSVSLVYKEEDRFMDVIDPEFELLTLLKNTSKEDYDHCVYTAVLCAKMAAKMGLNENVVKALGYYHRIGVVRGENNWENAEAVFTEYDLPPIIPELLAEYLNKNRRIRSREVGVLLVADTVISSITYLFSKDKDAQLNYDKLIGTIFDKKLESGVFDHSDISFEDIHIMKDTLIEEKLFYDFLR